jgi:hypothetical protein
VALLDEKDIIISRLNSKIDRLEKDNAVFIDRNTILHENLDELRMQNKNLLDAQYRTIQLQKQYDVIYKTLKAIATREVEDPVALAKRMLQNVE